jgi:hypothetical protein
MAMVLKYKRERDILLSKLAQMATFLVYILEVISLNLNAALTIPT